MSRSEETGLERPGKAGATEDTQVCSRGQVVWPHVRTQRKAWEGQCWTVLNAHPSSNFWQDGRPQQAARKEGAGHEKGQKTKNKNTAVEGWSHTERGEPGHHETAEEEAGERGGTATTTS